MMEEEEYDAVNDIDTVNNIDTVVDIDTVNNDSGLADVGDMTFEEEVVAPHKAPIIRWKGCPPAARPLKEVTASPGPPPSSPEVLVSSSSQQAGACYVAAWESAEAKAQEAADMLDALERSKILVHMKDMEEIIAMEIGQLSAHPLVGGQLSALAHMVGEDWVPSPRHNHWVAQQRVREAEERLARGEPPKPLRRPREDKQF